MIRVRISLWGGLALTFLAMTFKNFQYAPMEAAPINILSSIALWIAYGIALWFMFDAKYFRKENLKSVLFSTIFTAVIFISIMYINVKYFEGEIYMAIFWWIIVWCLITSRCIKDIEK